MRTLSFLFALMILAPAVLASEPIPRVSPIRPVATYSIVARDAVTGDLGRNDSSHGLTIRRSADLAPGDRVSN